MEQLSGKKHQAGILVRSMILTFLVTVVVLLFLAFLLLQLRLDVQKTEIGILASYVLSCFLGGLYCGKKTERKKFLWGAVIGAVYFLFLFLISGMSDQVFRAAPTQSLTALALCIGSGMLGGMLA